MPGINLVGQLKNPAAAPSGGFDAGGDLGGEGGPGLFERLRSMSGPSSLEWGREDTLRLLLVLLALGAHFGSRYFLDDYKMRLEGEVQAQIGEIEQQIANENRKLEGLRSLQAEAEAYDKQMGELRRKLELVESVSKNRNLIVRMVDFVVTEMPPAIWLGKLQVETGEKNEIDIAGSALNLQIVSEFMKRLEGAVFFPRWTLKETTVDTSGANAAGVPSVGGGAKANLPPPESKRFQINATVVPP
jgi:Tfp pilus assembly protein PilN